MIQSKSESTSGTPKKKTAVVKLKAADKIKKTPTKKVGKKAAATTKAK